MRIRKPKRTDQARTQKAYELLLDLIQNYQIEIDPALWFGAMVGPICAMASLTNRYSIELVE